MCKCLKINRHTQILSFQSFMSSFCTTVSSRIKLNSFHSLYLFSLVLSPVNSQTPIIPNTNEVSIDYQILRKKNNWKATTERQLGIALLKPDMDKLGQYQAGGSSPQWSGSTQAAGSVKFTTMAKLRPRSITKRKSSTET